MPAPIQHQPEQGVFETRIDGARGLIAYRLEGQVMVLTHTEVAAELEGRGIAGDLVRAALDHARSNGLTVDPQCDYARSYMQRHPETMALHV
ncbi:MAG: N-acetyltransferase [Pseudomonadota bacterium]|nr:N-acetyltransferase [Pseudomonadota bacterium]